MTTYTVDMPTVSSVVEEMQQIAASISSMIEGLDSSTASSLAGWTSAARDVYNQARAKWDAAAGDMRSQANNAANALSQINDAYGSAEVQGSNMWS
jgi:WXG100 family type VII secretion target